MNSTQTPITSFEIIDHGIDHGQYFQGCGVSYTDFEHVTTGCGSSTKEAFEDALEQMAMSGFDCASVEESKDGKLLLSDEADANTVEAFVARQGEEMTEDCELYAYVSIRWN